MQLWPRFAHDEAAVHTPPLHESAPQHGLVELQTSPAARQVGALAQVPEVEQVSPLQHRFVAEHGSPAPRQPLTVPHVPPLHESPEQHGLVPLQVCPVMRQLTP